MLRNPEAELLDDLDPVETGEWLDSLEEVLHRCGPQRVERLLQRLQRQAQLTGAAGGAPVTTPYVNSIPPEREPAFPGDRLLERRIKRMLRWNAMAIVVRANQKNDGIGGHIATFASSATLLEIGFQHFFKGPDHPDGPDFCYFQGHASPGIYARAYLEGRLQEDDLEHFRNETGPRRGLSSYPHPWLMPHFWQFPTVSMGLGPLMAIYHARFLRYAAARGVANSGGSHIWCYLGDGEMDEVESLGALSVAGREGLDNLTFIVNCNLQRLDGPVRGNGKIIQELEGVFRGAGWNVIKVVWSHEWDKLLAHPDRDALVRRMEEIVDGQYQKYLVEPPSFFREDFFGANPELRAMADGLTDDQIRQLRRGGHDPVKVYAAYHAAAHHRGQPTVILAKTVKGYALGENFEGRNTTHQNKKVKSDELPHLGEKFEIPLPKEKLAKAEFYRPPVDSPEAKYLAARREALGGSLPQRREVAPPLPAPALESLAKYTEANPRGASTTQAFVALLTFLLRDKNLGRNIVPIVPDESRTFGMEGMFKQFGIYSTWGQLYTPVDAGILQSYKESKDGQILQEGISEAGAMASFVAAGTAYANLGVNMIPFYIYYSMFGFQRIGDLAWAAGDSRCKGFLLGATAGRTTLNGEGLQHQDGHSLLQASLIPNCVAYDPAFAYEVSVVVQDGLRRMVQENEHVFYYLTLYNEPYEMPAMPEGSRDGILKGMYLFRSRDGAADKTARPQIFGSGPMLRQALLAQDLLAEKHGVGSDVWSVTSYTELRREALEAERWNRLHPDQPPRRSYVEQVLAGRPGPFVATSEYMRLVPEQIGRWVPGPFTVLGTDGFGRSDSREALRRHFEIDAASVVYATLEALSQQGQFDRGWLAAAAADLGLDLEQPFAQRA